MNDTCRCNQGYIGEKCTTPVITECDVNMCMNNGTCTQHVQTYTCDCLPGFIGPFCQQKEPTFHIRLINSSPRVSNGMVLIDFKTSKPTEDVECFLEGQEEQNCDNGHVQYLDVSAGSFDFLVQATSIFNETAIVRRIIHVGEVDDKSFCVVHLINEGLVVKEKSVALFYKGTKAVESYHCRLIGKIVPPFSIC